MRSLTRTLVLTEDKDGKIELFQFWLDFQTGEYCYSEVIQSSPLTNDFYEYHRLTNPIYDFPQHMVHKQKYAC